MRDFIFDQYGYYYSDSDASEFEFKGYEFKVMAHSLTENDLINMEEYIQYLYSKLNINPHCHIVKNRAGLYGVESKYGTVSLVSCLKREYKLDNLISFQHLEINELSKPYTISNLSTLWEEKLNLIEEKCVPYLKIDDFTYPIILKETIFAIGLCSNAIEYLTDMKEDYGNEVKNLCYAHKRLYDLTSFDLFNPFNIVIDSPTRDLAFLYKEKAINLNELISIIDYYKLDQMEISLLMARALFPTATFDILEDYFALKKDIKLSIVKKHKKTKREVNLLVELHKRLVEKYKIRPIEWLLNYTN